MFDDMFDWQERQKLWSSGARKGNLGAMVEGFTGIDFTPGEGNNLRSPLKNTGATYTKPIVETEPEKIDPNVEKTITGDGGGDSGLTFNGTSTYDAQQAAEEAERMARIAKLRDEIGLDARQLNAVYEAMFGDLSGLVKERSSQLEKDYADQFKKTADQYAAAIPQISNSYAAIGAADSTDKSDAKDGAKKGFDDTTATIGNNKKKDLTTLGSYQREQEAKIKADQRSVNENAKRAAETDDEDALRGLRNDIEGKQSEASVTRATLGKDGSARTQLAKMTGDNGRFEQAVNALDGIIKSSMSGAVKQAAVKSIVDNAGLTDEEKEKVNLQYGDVYQEQQAL